MNVFENKGTVQENENLITLKRLNEQDNAIRQDVKDIIKKADPDVATKDTDYVFLNFVLNNMPKGLIGLLLAVMFCAAMSSTSGQISSLASTTVIDFYKTSINKNKTDAHYVKATKYSPCYGGAVIIGFAVSLRLFDNLIKPVNIVGSLFYGTILGVFLVAFFFKSVKGTATFWAAILSEGIIIALYFIDKHESISFLWYNAIGPGLVIGLSIILNMLSSCTRYQVKG